MRDPVQSPPTTVWLRAYDNKAHSSPQPPTSLECPQACPHQTTLLRVTPGPFSEIKHNTAAAAPRSALPAHPQPPAGPRASRPSKQQSSTHGGGFGRPGRPGQRALQPFLPQGLVLGEVPRQLHQGVGAPALRLHQLPHGHGAGTEGERVGAESRRACTWRRDGTDSG